MAISAVSLSRISPIHDIRDRPAKPALMVVANVRPILGCTCTCRRPSCVISIGSSAVQSFRSSVLIDARMACNVVVFGSGRAAHKHDAMWFCSQLLDYTARLNAELKTLRVAWGH